MKIVAIGASAGGQHAITDFLKNCPAATGCAYVIIQHLKRDFPSQADLIFQRYSSMKVNRIQGGEEPQPNQVYVMPEGKKLLMEGKRFKLINRPATEIINNAIDDYFISLSENLGNKAIGVILSGTGSDGTKGAFAIEEKGGIIIVQDPHTADFPGMPLNNIENDHPDHILPPEQMPELILQYAD